MDSEEDGGTIGEDGTAEATAAADAAVCEELGAGDAEAVLTAASGSLRGCWGDEAGAGEEEGEVDGWMGEAVPFKATVKGRLHADTGARVDAAVSPLTA